ncbi:metalloprotease TIKI1-like [Protobothrops mucrosquamatus]|uniref:metalloprotease TIKI1-like n=1 Tax=Protobothrops mucrosquamatus TaxID=103944 RepID=UPI000775D519|nr:metalloprotease TIKI1-like [Protobothrops mucrosquamatus]
MCQALQLHGSGICEIRAGLALQQVAEQGRARLREAGARQERGEAGPALLCLAGQGLRHPRLRRRRAWTVQDSQVIFALNQTLLQQENLRAGSLQIPYNTEDLIKHYNCGDLNTVIFNHDTSQVPNFINASLLPHERITAQEIDDYFRHELIYKRNERMGKRVKDLLEEYPDKSFFFAFGAGHFMGNNTVIDILRRKGYEVDHTSPGQAISGKNRQKLLSALSSTSPEYASFIISQEIQQQQEEEEEEELLLDTLLPENMDLLEKAERKYKKKKKKQPKKQRQFNDLWVRIEESTTEPPLRIHIINGYISVEPQPRGHKQSRHIQADRSCSTRPFLFFFTSPNSELIATVTVSIHLFKLDTLNQETATMD